jgi:transcriptional regulator with XRE-family HTH domain
MPASPPFATHPTVARPGAAGRAVGGATADSRALARLVAARRHELGLTQLELARRMRATLSVVASIERGAHPPRLETLQRLFGALECRLVVGYELGPIEAPTAGEAVAVSDAGSSYSTREVRGRVVRRLAAGQRPSRKRRPRPGGAAERD